MFGPGAAPQGLAVPPVAVTRLSGLPADKQTTFTYALAAAGGGSDIGFIGGNAAAGQFSLDGDFQAVVALEGVRVAYRIELRDGRGQVAHAVSGEDSAGLPTGIDPWAAVSSPVLDRIARRVVETTAFRLKAMGYATRVADLHVPPAEYFAMAGPDAHRDIDFETLNGPGAAMASGDDMVVPPADPLVADGAVAPQPGEAEIAATDHDAAEQSREPAAGKVDIRAVAVMQVKGSPGGGDAELTAAMRRTLAEAGWPVVTERRPDALTIVGRVKVAAPTGRGQAVSVRWEVQSPDGKTLGDVKQANEVPAGALDAGWGDMAMAVAQAAAAGIFDIVRRFQ